VRRTAAILVSGGWLCLAPAGVAAQTKPLVGASAADVAAGQRTFDAQCAWCHGAGGAGGTGPNLQRTSLRHAATDGALVDLVRNGIPGTDMPSFAVALTETMAWQTAAYVRALGRASGPPVPGDPERGGAVYQSSGCAGCHVISGRGGVLGPELTSVGALRGAPYLRESLIKPEAAHPPGYLVVRAVTTAGVEVRGIRVNEDVFWILIRDASGTLRTLQKSALARLEREPESTLMPSYASRLPPGELDDLVAYLASLRGAR
jgi:putative heme-binding domain-containing protein